MFQENVKHFDSEDITEDVTPRRLQRILQTSICYVTKTLKVGKCEATLEVKKVHLPEVHPKTQDYRKSSQIIFKRCVII